MRQLPRPAFFWIVLLVCGVYVPITGSRERLVGVFLLGERMSDEPYGATDRRLLQGIAAQVGLVYENQHLKERVRLDADVRRDVIARLDEKPARSRAGPRRFRRGLRSVRPPAPSPVAAKVMMGSLFGDRDALRRFEREARARCSDGRRARRRAPRLWRAARVLMLFRT